VSNHSLLLLFPSVSRLGEVVLEEEEEEEEEEKEVEARGECESSAAE